MRSSVSCRVSFSENMYVTIEYSSEPIPILCKQYDDLPIVREDERLKCSGAPCSQMMICEE